MLCDVASDMKKPAPTERVRWLKPSIGASLLMEREGSISQAWPGVVAGGDISPGQLAPLPSCFTAGCAEISRLPQFATANSVLVLGL